MPNLYNPNPLPRSGLKELANQLEMELAAISKHLLVSQTTIVNQTTVGGSSGSGASASVSDERIDDRVATLIQSSDTITWTYDDALATLTGVVEDNTSVQKVAVSQNSSGTDIGTRRRLNLIDTGTAIWSVTDDNTNDELDIEVDAITSLMGFWRFDTSTTAADPGSGDVRYDNATLASVLNIYISQTTTYGTDAEAFLDQIESADGVYIQQRGDATKWARWVVSSTPTDNGDWWTIPVTYRSSGSGGLPSNNATVVVQFTIGASGTVTAHNLLSTSHSDTLTDTVSQGALVVGNSTPKWSKFAIGSANTVLRTDGTDPSWAKLVLSTDVTGVLALTNGGSNKALTASAGGIVWTDADSMEVLAGTATAGLALVSGASATPSWFTPTAGSVLFAGTGGILQQDNANFFWDDSNNRLGLGGITSPAQTLAVVGATTTSTYLRVGSNSTPSDTNVGTITTPNIIIGSAATAKIIIDGVDGAETSGQDSLFESGGDFKFTSRNDFFFGLDNDANATGAFRIRSGGVAGTHVWIVNEDGNVGYNGQTSWGTSAAGVLALKSGTGPSTSPTDAVQWWSADTNSAAGKAGLHLRTEDGTQHVLGNLVGIGNIVPTHMLDVSGDTLTTGYLRVGSISSPTNTTAGDATMIRLAVGNTSLGSNTVLVTQPVVTTGSPSIMTLTGGAHTTLTASTEAIDLNVNLARTVQFSTGALTLQRAALFQAPTYGFVGASTITDAATLAITGAPVAGTNTTQTQTHALLIQAGAVSSGTRSYGLTVNAQTGATTNYAAVFLGGRVGVGTASPGASLAVDYSSGTASVASTITNSATGGSLQQGLLLTISGSNTNNRGITVIVSGGTNNYGIFNDATLNSFSGSLKLSDSGLGAPTAALHIGTSTTIGHIRMDGIAGNPGTPTAGDYWYNTSAKGHRVYQSLGTLGLSGLFYSATADSSDITGVDANEHDYDTGSFTVPAGGINVAGMVIMVRAFLTNDHDNSAPNLTVRLKYGGTTIQSITFTPNASSTSDDPLSISYRITIRSTGATAGVFVDWFYSYYNGATWTSFANSTLTSVDLTASGALKFSAQFSGTDTNSKTRIKAVHMEVLNSAA